MNEAEKNNEVRKRVLKPVKALPTAIETQVEAEQWFARARAGDAVVYFRGASLSAAKVETEVVRDPVTGDVEISALRNVPRHRRTKAARQLEEMCEWLHGMSDVGRLALTQKQVRKPDEDGDGAIYEFRATKVW